MKYKDKETGEIRTYEEIKKEWSEIIYNSSYADEDIKDIKDFEEFLKKFYVELE